MHNKRTMLTIVAVITTLVLALPAYGQDEANGRPRRIDWSVLSKAKPPVLNEADIVEIIEVDSTANEMEGVSDEEEEEEGVDCLDVFDEEQDLSVAWTYDDFAYIGRITFEIEYDKWTQKQKELVSYSCYDKQVKSVCMTPRHTLYVSRKNDFKTSLPRFAPIVKTLTSLKEGQHEVCQACFTESGWWCVVYDTNQVTGNLPKDMKQLLKRCEGQQILSVSIAENGRCAIVTDQGAFSSDDECQEMMTAAVKYFGRASSTCITNKGYLVICERGLIFDNLFYFMVNNWCLSSSPPRMVSFTDAGRYMVK